MQTFVELDIVTAGTLPGCEKPGIDHIAISSHLRAARVQGWPKNVTGTVVTDHDAQFGHFEVARSRSVAASA